MLSPHLKYVCIIRRIDRHHLLQCLYLDHSLRHQLCLHFPAAIETWYRRELWWNPVSWMWWVQGPRAPGVILPSMLNHSDTGNGLYTREVFGEYFVMFRFCLFLLGGGNLKTQWAKLTRSISWHWDWFYLLVDFCYYFYSISIVV